MPVYSYFIHIIQILLNIESTKLWLQKSKYREKKTCKINIKIAKDKIKYRMSIAYKNKIKHWISCHYKYLSGDLILKYYAINLYSVVLFIYHSHSKLSHNLKYVEQNPFYLQMINLLYIFNICNSDIHEIQTLPNNTEHYFEPFSI